MARDRAPAIMAEPLVPAFKSLEEARAMAAICRRCDLYQSATKAVFGEGSPHARLMIVGEGPGAEEDRQGRPFVGSAGRLLGRWLEMIELAREDVWITNAVKHRAAVAEGTTWRNRPPRIGEVRACRVYLETELALIRPQLILCLGAMAARLIISKDFRLMAERGRWFPGPGPSQALATFHPAYVLRQKDDDRDRVEALVARDLAAVREAYWALPPTHAAEAPEIFGG